MNIRFVYLPQQYTHIACNVCKRKIKKNHTACSSNYEKLNDSVFHAEELALNSSWLLFLFYCNEIIPTFNFSFFLSCSLCNIYCLDNTFEKDVNR